MTKRAKRKSPSTPERIESESMKVSEPEQVLAIGQACAPLFAALEEGVLSSDTQQEDGEFLHTQENIRVAIQPLVKLFSKQADRNEYIKMIQSSKFQKRHARRLFAAIQPLLERIIEEELYVPQSAYESDNEEGGEESKDDNATSPQNTSSNSKRTSDISQVTATLSKSDLDEVTPDPESTQALHFMKYSAMMIQSYLQNAISRNNKQKRSSSNTDKELPSEVLIVAELLHDELFSLISCGKEGATVQKTIASMCELYWNGSFVDRELVVVQLIPYLVLKTLDGKATRADLKRLMNMRFALELIDFDEVENIAHLKGLLLRTVSSPLYLKHSEGRKIIAFLFQLNHGLIKDLHSAIRVQIPLAKKDILNSYGEIYFAAWKESLNNQHCLDEEEDMNEDDESSKLGSIQSVIEEHVLQDLMYASIHIASVNMAKSIRTILEPIHSKKRTPEVDLLLYRMYGPILWRSLAAPNPLVRINASSILSLTFPLHDPHAGKMHMKEMNCKSFESLKSLLNDLDPKVRVAGCNATIKILGVYWDALSSTDIRALLNDIILKHASDISSVAVRVQAVHGISMLLDAKASHAALRPLLPLIGNLIHDSQERVRLATAQLLLKLKKLKGFKYYHVVPSNHLLARLTTEAGKSKSMITPVASSLTDLLSNSYFPKGARGSEQVRRTLVFLKSNPKSAKVFYSNLPYHLDLNNVSKLLVMLMKVLTSSGEKDQIEDGNPSQSGSKTEIDTAASNVSLMAEVAETINIILTSVRVFMKSYYLKIFPSFNTILVKQKVSDSLSDPENEECKNFVIEAMNDRTIVDLCLHFQDKAKKVDHDSKTVQEYHRINLALLHCTGNLSEEIVEGFSSLLSSNVEFMNSTLGHIQSEKYFLSSLATQIAVLCMWGKSKDVVTALSSFISNEFDTQNDFWMEDETAGGNNDPDTNGTSRRKKRKASHTDRVSKIDFPDIIPALSGKIASKVIGAIIGGTSQSSLRARKIILSSEIACSQIESSLEKAEEVAETILASTVSMFSDE